MKKLFAAVIALIMLMSVAAVSAEEATETASMYVMAGVQNADGEVVVSEEFPVLVFVIDAASDKCAFGTEEEQMEGTYTIAEQTDEYLVLNLALADGTEMVITYVIADDAFAIVDADSGLTLVLMNIEALAEAAAE